MIIVYTQPVCEFCTKAKDFLREKGLQYNEIDVTKNEHAKQFVIHKTQQRKVPVIQIDDELIVGFDGLQAHFAGS